jgi:hypothetical protein
MLIRICSLLQHITTYGLRLGRNDCAQRTVSGDNETKVTRWIQGPRES